MARRAEELYGQAELRTAADRRTAHHVFDLSVRPESGPELRVFELEEELMRCHRKASRNRQRATEAALFKSVIAHSASWLLFADAYVAAALLVLRQVGRGQATAGDVALTLGLAMAVVGAAATLSGLAGSATRTRTTADHYHWLRSRTATETRTAQLPARLAGGIVLEDVAFSYPGKERPTLSGLSLRLPAGSVVALVGENGAGKTTLVKLLCGMYQPISGRILFRRHRPGRSGPARLLEACHSRIPGLRPIRIPREGERGCGRLRPHGGLCSGSCGTGRRRRALH